ncbi:MAG: hypothetical protein JKY48_00695 [Flavobacteriales bacterium]|nr:hypothetical protein [Flavobacteriales bacterium]
MATKVISVSYETPLNNNPKKYKNWIGLWKGSYINYTDSVLQRIFIEDSKRCGSYAFDSLALEVGQDYIVGYGLGDSLSSVAATLFLPWQSPQFKTGKSTRTLVKPIEIGSNYIVIHYCSPLGNNPKANNNWIGIQQGQTFSYTNNRFKKYRINDSEYSGDLVINNFPFARNTWYTIVYGIGKQKKDIAASWTFNGNEAQYECQENCLSCNCKKYH